MENKILKFKGTHKEIGIQVGEQYKRWGRKDFYVPQNANKVFPTQLKIYEKFFPRSIEYLEGIAVGMAMPKDKVILSGLTSFLPATKNSKPEEKCSAFVIKNKNGILIGRNYDWRQASEENAKLIEIEFAEKSANNLRAISDMATWKMGGKADPSKFLTIFNEAWNDAGLYICLNSAPGKQEQIGMNACHIVQLVTETCASVKEATDLILKIPTETPKIFTIADKTGNMAVIERSLESGPRLRTSNKNFIIATNHFIHEDLLIENEDIFIKIPRHSTSGRYQYLQTMLLKNPEINLREIFPMMIRPPTAQEWRDEDAVTCWTNCLNLSTGEYETHFAPLLTTTEIVKNNGSR